MSSLRSPDTIILPVPLALMLRSAADRKPVGEGLRVRAELASGASRPFDLQTVPSGYWAAHQIPGIPADVALDPSRWVADGALYNFNVEDENGRYLPMRFSAPLPRRNALIWPGWAGLDRGRLAPLLPPASGASFVPDYLTLFPSSSAGGSQATARVLAHLAVRETGGATRSACWAMMSVSFGSTVVGLGMSDARGAISVHFAYPPMPAPTPAEAAAGRENVSWPVQIRVYCSELGDPDLPDDPPPDFASIIAQLETTPRVAMATIMGMQPPLGDQTLMLGQPLVLRTAVSGGQFAPSLFLKPA